MSKVKKIGRPVKLNDSDRIFIQTQSVFSRLQANSERRAIVNRIIDLGGNVTISQINEAFGYDTRLVVFDLIRIGWLDYEQVTEEASNES